MKSPLVFPNQFSSAPRRRPALDVRTQASSADAVVHLRPVTAVAAPPLSRSRRPMLDGVRTEKQALLTRLHRRSWRDAFWLFWRRGEMYLRRTRRLLSRLTPSLAPQKMLYGSLIGGIAFGMVSMALVGHFFGPGVFARSSEPEPAQRGVSGTAITAEGGITEAVPEQAYNSESDIFFEYFNEAADAQYQDSVRQMVKGYPIEEMLPYIFEQDRLTAAFLIGIAKKESNWGKRVPVLNNQDCFNYWGYRGIRRMMGSGGHTCFNSRKDAVDTVSKRLNTLINSQKLNTPEKMIIWKCGFSCEGQSRESVKKWISDVDLYFKKLSEE